MSKHTPGPWTAEPNSAHGISFSVEGGGRLITRFASAADARLIAAAPDLLAALRAMTDYMAYAEALGEDKAVFKNARAAIAKAEGCCQFHASGGDKTLSCGGDIAKAEGAS